MMGEHALPREVLVGEVTIGGMRPMALIAGPCVMESREMTLAIAKALAKVGEEFRVPVIFKASFDKANRMSLESFRGPGLEEGLAILAEVKSQTGLPVNTDIHEPGQAGRVAEVADMLQIPAYLCRQTDLVAAAARTGKPVLIKKGQFMAPEDMGPVAAKAAESPPLGIIVWCATCGAWR